MIFRLAPYAVTFGLVGSAMAWQHVAPSGATPGDPTHPKVAVANYVVPAAVVASPAPGGPVTIAELKPQSVKPFSLVGVTWASGMPKTAKIDVQWHGRRGWSKWTDLDQELVPLEDGAGSGRPGTEPQWVNWADAIAVRVTNATDARPVDLQVAAVTGGEATAIAPAAVTQPGIILRSQWGARKQTSCEDPIYGRTTLGAVIHHTVGKNSYAKSESAGIVRDIQAYHMRSRGWCDIGYNFLVDKYGQIFEGRAGGINRPVRGAHAGNKPVNEETMGVSLMGTFTNVAPSAAMKEATARLVAWRFANYHIPAKGTYTLGGKTLNRIAGHRNVINTECPGQYAYAWLSASGGLRDRVAQLLAAGGATAAAVPTLSGVAVSPTSIRYAWSRVRGAATYQLAVSRHSNFSEFSRVSTTSTMRTTSGMSAGTTYYAKVRAMNAKGKAMTAYSAVVVKRTPVPTAASQIPRNLHLAGRSSSSLDFQWSAVSGAAKYQVRLSRWTTMVNSTISGSKNLDESFKGLSANTRYYAQVRAVKADGSPLGSWSSRVSAVTDR